MVSDFALGTLLAGGAAILFGAHTSFAKTESVVKSGVAMPIYNIYFLLGAAIVNIIEYIILAALGEVIEFTYLGIICGILLLCFENTLLLSIQQIGVGYATGFSVFSAAIVTPILQVILNQPIAIWWVMVIGLIMLALSVFFMSVLKDVLKCCAPSPSPSSSAAGNDQVALQMGDEQSEQTALLSQQQQQEQAVPTDNNQEMKISRCSMILGLLFSTLAGIFMAVLPLPSLYAEGPSAGLNFFLSFGVGCLVVMPLSGMIAVVTHKGNGGPSTQQSTEKGGEPTLGNDAASVIPYNLMYKMLSLDNEVWHFKDVVVPAVSAGIIWGIGNICGFCSFLYLSYTVAVSFVQCNVIVAMFLGVVVWKEVTNKMEIFTLFVLSLVLVAGCAVVVYGVFGSF